MTAADMMATAAAKLNAEGETRPLPEEDALPSFTSLTNDDDWQRKAGHHPPGTYYVVANPESFQHLEEYRQGRDEHDTRPVTSLSDREWVPQAYENDQETRPPSTTYTGSTSQTPITFEADDSYYACANTVIDSKTIVLGMFEEDLHRTPHWGLVSPRITLGGGTNTSMAQSPALTVFSRSLDGLSVSAVQPVQNRVSVARSPTEQELHLLLHYRNFVSRHIVQIRRDRPDDTRAGSLQEMDIFEQEASTFPPVRYNRHIHPKHVDISDLAKAFPCAHGAFRLEPRP